jgi:hypothetical protein
VGGLFQKAGRINLVTTVADDNVPGAGEASLFGVEAMRQADERPVSISLSPHHVPALPAMRAGEVYVFLPLRHDWNLDFGTPRDNPGVRGKLYQS